MTNNPMERLELMQAEYSIDLLFLSETRDAVQWKYGNTYRCKPLVNDINIHLEKFLRHSISGYLLIWNPELGLPDHHAVLKIPGLPGHVWHSGLSLGLSRFPKLLDYISNSWMLLSSAPGHIPSSSWRLSIDCCLFSRSVLKYAGSLPSGYQSLAGAGLEYGHRLIMNGVILRHCPLFFTASPPNQQAIKLSPEDEYLFCRRRYGLKWTAYAGFRQLLNGELSAVQLYGLLNRTGKSSDSKKTDIFEPELPYQKMDYSKVGYSIIIPTVGRYEYLAKLLEQLRTLSTPPLEIIIADQSPKSSKPPGFYSNFTDLPLKVIQLKEAGQCSSRNAAIQSSSGDYILLIDDDVSVKPGFINEHFDTIFRYGADVSCGVFDEAGRGPLPAHFTYARVSEVFPSCNGMISRKALKASGLFDLAYEKGPRADLDLGTRLYLSGALLMINPVNSVYHHHAISGGLRTHKARKQTFAKARASLFKVRLPSATEWYLNYRFFTKKQQHEKFVQSLVVLLSLEGPLTKKLMKIIFLAWTVPLLYWRLKRQLKLGHALARTHPTIPRLK